MTDGHIGSLFVGDTQRCWRVTKNNIKKGTKVFCGCCVRPNPSLDCNNRTVCCSGHTTDYIGAIVQSRRLDEILNHVDGVNSLEDAVAHYLENRRKIFPSRRVVEWLNIWQVAELTGYSRNYLEKAFRFWSWFGAKKICGRWYVRRKTLEDYIKSLRKGHPYFNPPRTLREYMDSLDSQGSDNL